MCSEILSEYSDVPLFQNIKESDARSLLLSSFYGTAPDDEICELNETSFGDEPLLSDYLATTKPEDIFIPAILLEGTLLLNFPSGTPSSPMTAAIEAPIISYLVPFARDAETVNPSMAVTGLSKGIVFHPEKFKKITYANPQMSDAILEDRERILSLLLRWLPVNSYAPIGYRIARFLLTQIPENSNTEEIISLTQDAIAKYLNCSRATLAKGIALLHDKGIIRTGHGKIVVHSDKLKVYIRENQTTGIQGQ